MNKAELVTSALLHKETERIPCHMELTPAAEKRFAAEFGQDALQRIYAIQHIKNWMYTGRPLAIDTGKDLYLDDYGVVWDRTVDKDLGTMHKLPIPDITKRNYTMPALDKDKLRAEYREFLDSGDDRFAVAGLGLAVYERAWTLCGIDHVLYAMDNHPGKLQNLFDDILENALQVVDTAAEFGFKAFFVGDDWEDEGILQLQMGQAHWRTFIKPVLQGIFARAHSHGMFTMQHSCGNIEVILPDLIEIGLDCYQTVQPERYDMAFLKKEYGKDITFWGGLSTKAYLPVYNAEQAKEHAISTMRLMKTGGGYIAAPSHVLPDNIHPQTVMAILDVFEHQEKYL